MVSYVAIAEGERQIFVYFTENIFTFDLNNVLTEVKNWIKEAEKIKLLILIKAQVTLSEIIIIYILLLYLELLLLRL